MTTNAGTDNRTFLVGGAVRDYFRGKPSMDFDFAVEIGSFDAMRQWLVDNSFTIFLETPEYLTIRARRKEPWSFAGFAMEGLTFDFVMCRKDGAYSDGRRPDEVHPGTIYDDLARRDFTINAMALDAEGRLIDPFSGRADLDRRIIRCVGGVERLYEDGLRMLRALRFSLQLGFNIGEAEKEALNHPGNMVYLKSVSTDRIRAELTKCFRTNVTETLNMLSQYPSITDTVFQETDLWLKPTSEKR